MHCSSRSLLTRVFSPVLSRPSTLPPSFLIPSISTTQTLPFSSSTRKEIRKDRNPNRGISALRHTGLRKRQKLSVDLDLLPKPVLDPRKRSEVQVDEDHGLWDFFNREREALMTPPELDAHGRGWSVAELRRRDWEDLWKLWWVCVKERNRTDTFLAERERIGDMLGEEEGKGRVKAIKQTQSAIKFTLTERWYAWENARREAMDDPEVNLYADPEKGDLAYLPLGQQREPILSPTESESTAYVADNLPPTAAESARPLAESRA